MIPVRCKLTYKLLLVNVWSLLQMDVKKEPAKDFSLLASQTFKRILLAHLD
jgi:hypothetical protein